MRAVIHRLWISRCAAFRSPSRAWLVASSARGRVSLAPSSADRSVGCAPRRRGTVVRGSASLQISGGPAWLRLRRGRATCRRDGGRGACLPGRLLGLSREGSVRRASGGLRTRRRCSERKRNGAKGVVLLGEGKGQMPGGPTPARVTRRAQWKAPLAYHVASPPPAQSYVECSRRNTNRFPQSAHSYSLRRNPRLTLTRLVGSTRRLPQAGHLQINGSGAGAAIAVSCPAG
jgi:hypothetical protein